MPEKITSEMVANLHRKREEIRGQINQAKGRLEMLEKQRDAYIEELKEYGVTPETAPAKIEELEKEIELLYSEASSIIESIKDATDNVNEEKEDDEEN